MSQSAHFLVVKNHVLILVMNNNIFINLENLTNKPIFPKTLMNQNSKLNHHVLINYEQQQQIILTTLIIIIINHKTTLLIIS
jgi:hypothetical protein